MDGLGNIYIVDGSSDNPYVYRFNPTGKYFNRFGGKGKQPGQFDVFVDSLVLDGQSRLCVSNTSAVDVFDADDRYLTIIDSNVYGGGSRDIAINQPTNEIYILGIKDKVYKLALNAAK